MSTPPPRSRARQRGAEWAALEDATVQRAHDTGRVAGIGEDHERDADGAAVPATRQPDRDHRGHGGDVQLDVALARLPRDVAEEDVGRWARGLRLGRRRRPIALRATGAPFTLLMCQISG